MPRRRLALIAFDGDDTLWHNERSYREGRDRFRRLLARAGVALTEEEIEAHVNRTELQNLEYYGYGVSSFVLSLIETALDLTGGRVPGSELRDMIDLIQPKTSEEPFCNIRRSKRTKVLKSALLGCGFAAWSLDILPAPSGFLCRLCGAPHNRHYVDIAIMWS